MDHRFLAAAALPGAAVAPSIVSPAPGGPLQAAFQRRRTFCISAFNMASRLSSAAAAFTLRLPGRVRTVADRVPRRGGPVHGRVAQGAPALHRAPCAGMPSHPVRCESRVGSVWPPQYRGLGRCGPRSVVTVAARAAVRCAGASRRARDESRGAAARGRAPVTDSSTPRAAQQHAVGVCCCCR